MAQKQNQKSSTVLEKGLPQSDDAERLVLGAILTDESAFVQVAGTLEPDDFSIEKHRRIFQRMHDLNDRGEKIDRITLTHELIKQGQLESVDGMGYLVTLDEGMPKLRNIEGYAGIVKETSQLRRLANIGSVLSDAAIQQGSTSSELIASYSDELLRMETSDKSDTQTIEEVITEFPGGVNAFLDPSTRKRGLQTGFIKFDEMTGGLMDGELIILAARPSMGKTALALNIAQSIATKKDNPRPVAIFSLEMSKESLLTRMMCSTARVDLLKFRMGWLNQDERRQLMRAMTDLTAAPIHIDDTAGVTFPSLHAKLRKLKQTKDISLAVIDYLQLMSGGGQKFDNATAEITHITRGLKLMAGELGIPIVVLSQLSREPEKRTADNRPKLSDLRQSGSIEQDADLVAFIFREEVYKPKRDDLKGQAELIIGKQRNGPIGTVKLIFAKQITRFENAASVFDETQEEPGASLPDEPPAERRRDGKDDDDDEI